MGLFIVEGWVEATDGTRVCIRLDNVQSLHFDRDKETRGWWVSTHPGRIRPGAGPTIAC
jgi:hypothetical protein